MRELERWPNNRGLVSRMAKLDGLSEFSVYAIRHSKDLDTMYRRGGSVFVEQNRWVEGKRLFLDATHKGLTMPLVLAAAEDISGLHYFAILTDVMSNPADTSTTIRFTGLTRLKKELPLSTLILKSTHKPLSKSFINSYAICHTPEFLG
jgi:hypothetical protein